MIISLSACGFMFQALRECFNTLNCSALVKWPSSSLMPIISNMIIAWMQLETFANIKPSMSELHSIFWVPCLHISWHQFLPRWLQILPCRRMWNIMFCFVSPSLKWPCRADKLYPHLPRNIFSIFCKYHLRNVIDIIQLVFCSVYQNLHNIEYLFVIMLLHNTICKRCSETKYFWLGFCIFTLMFVD